jgi:outer membrane protein with beta-barrel domain
MARAARPDTRAARRRTMNARRPSLLLAFVAAAAVALPSLASAQARRPAGGGFSGFGILIGFEDSKYDNGLALRLDGEIPLQALSPVVRMSLVGSLGYTRFSFNPGGFFGTESETLNIFKVTPALRFTFGNHPMIRPYADAGIGLHYARLSVPCFDQFGNLGTCSDSDVSAHLRFAGGLTFQISPGLGLGAEVDLIPYFGKVDDNTFSLLFVLAFRS